MSTAEEKKWFIYVGDHHEGPFSLDDLQGKMDQGVISTASYVWADGMADWQLMTDIQALASLFRRSSSSSSMAAALAVEVPALVTDAGIEAIAPPVADTIAQPMSVILAEAVQEPSSPRSSYVSSNSPSGASAGRSAAVSLSAAQNSILQSTNHLDPRKSSPIRGESITPPRHPIVRLIKLLVFLGVIGGTGYAHHLGYLDSVLKAPAVKSATDKVWDFAQPYLLKVTEKAPFLAKWISPIPQLPDVSPEEYDELRSAATASPESPGPKFAVALSKGNSGAPTFYVAGNVSDGTRFKVVINGVPESLLNQISFDHSAPVSVEKRFGKVGPLKSRDGSPFPRGQYLVTLIEAPDNPVERRAEVAKLVSPLRPGEPAGLVRPLVAKSYFLGGPKDAAYASRLKEFHDSLAKKASEELLEVKAYSDHFEKQLSESNQRFIAVKKGSGVSSTRKRVWVEFHGKWSKSWGQMSQIFEKWTPDSIKTDRFYGGLFTMVMQTAQAVEKAHGFQDSFVSGGGDRKALEIQIGEAKAGASNAVIALKSRIELIEKSPTSPNGMPIREDQIGGEGQPFPQQAQPEPVKK